MSQPQSRLPSRFSRLPLTVIDRMIALELAKTLISILLVLVTIIVSRKFLDILTKAIEGEVSVDIVFWLLGLKTLTAAAVLIPPSLFMAILTVTGRMYRDHEMSVLASAGVGAPRFYRALSWIVIPVLLLSAYLALEVMPWSERHIQQLILRDVETHDVRGIKPGRFNEFSSGDVVLYAEEIDPDRYMRNIFVQSRQNATTGVVIAERGKLHKAENGDDFVVLNDGRRYQGIPGTANYVISEFQEYGVRISGPQEISAALKREATDTRQLLISHTPPELAELQKRVAIPLGVVALTLLAVPLARVSPRQGPYGNVFSAFLIYIIYENAQKISQGMLMTGKLPPWAAYAGIYGLLLLMTLVLFAKNLGPRWLSHTLGLRAKI
jgi:lipopolysaccharide export system permease protein